MTARGKRRVPSLGGYIVMILVGLFVPVLAVLGYRPSGCTSSASSPQPGARSRAPMPVVSTNKMPSNVRRSSTRGRPMGPRPAGAGAAAARPTPTTRR
jgi:hypothetical protein